MYPLRVGLCVDAARVGLWSPGEISRALHDLARATSGVEHVHVRTTHGEAVVTLLVAAPDETGAVASAAAFCTAVEAAGGPLLGWSVVVGRTGRS